MKEISRMRESGRFVLGYIGTFGRVNGVDVLVRAAEIAEERAPGRVGLLLVGDGPDRESVERLARSVPAVTVRAAVAKQHVPEILRALDATVVHATATPVYRYGISFNKLFEYMAAGRPVVFACESTYDPVAEAGAGVTVPPNDPERIAAALLEMAATTPETRTAMGEAGRAFVTRNHDLAYLGLAFAAVVEGDQQPSAESGSRDR
jgi:glycosyltransferase involved in cell wall biosynthesis